jgi:two-component system, cell cycle response regulator
MTNPVLQKVLASPALPTPPAVAIRVLELTRDPNATIADIGKLIQNDPALSAKVLKTVNSSLFGLPQQVSRIDRALGLMGLNAAKSLVLGFSLVDSTKSAKGAGLDLQAHWRRSIYSAAGARHLATLTKVCDPDEAFTAAVFQDMGVLAAAMALNDAYAPALAAAGTQHDLLPAVETKVLGIDHAQIGAALMERWKMPAAYVNAVRWHHAPDQAPEDVRRLAQVVYLGGVIAESLNSPQPMQHVAWMMVNIGTWFTGVGIDVKEILTRAADGAAELAKVFEKDIGQSPNIQAILAEASEEAMAAQIATQREAAELARKNDELAKAAVTDGLTKIANRKAFDPDLITKFEICRSSDMPIAVLFIDGDKFKSVNDRFGHPAGDAVLVELAKRISTAVADTGKAYRYGGEEFTVIAPALDAAGAAQLAEHVRKAVESPAFNLKGVPGAPDTLPVTVSIGVAATDPKHKSRFANCTEVVKAADEAVYTSKQMGRNRVTVAGPQRPATTTPAATAEPAKRVRVLLVDDDALAGKLLQLAMQKRAAVEVVWSMTAKEAEVLLVKSAAGTPFDLVVSDHQLADGTGLDIVKRARGNPAYRLTPILLMSASENLDVDWRAAGVTAFATKRDLCVNLNRWMDTIFGDWLTAKKAA